MIVGYNTSKWAREILWGLAHGANYYTVYKKFQTVSCTIVVLTMMASGKVYNILNELGSIQSSSPKLDMPTGSSNVTGCKLVWFPDISTLHMQMYKRSLKLSLLWYCSRCSRELTEYNYKNYAVSFFIVLKWVFTYACYTSMQIC